MKIPNNEKIWVTYLEDNQPTHYITSNKTRDTYKLYDKDFTLISKNDNPIELESLIYKKDKNALF